MALGSSIHSALEGAYREWTEGEPAPIDLAKETFRRDLEIRLEDPLLQFGEKENPESLMATGLALLTCWAREAKYENVIETEANVTAPLVHPVTGETLAHELTGWIDLLVRDSETGKPVIVDFKTSARRFAAGQVDGSPQARIYGYVIRRLHGIDSVDLEWRILVKNKTPILQRIQVSQGSEGDARLFELVRTIQRAVESGIFWPVDNPMVCGGCPYTRACAKWQDDPSTLRPDSASQLARRSP